MTTRAMLLPVWILAVVAICAADPLGTVNEIGTTWFDQQKFGSSGRLISVDETGQVHFTWTNGLSNNAFNRHVYYNIWNPGSQSFNWDGGLQVDAGVRAGYVTQAAAPDGRCYPIFDGPETAMGGIDFFSQAGAFSCASVCLPDGETELHYPKAAFGNDGKLHVLAVGSEANGFFNNPVALYYLRGTPIIDEFGFGVEIEWDQLTESSCAVLLDSLLVPAYEIVASPTGDRLAAVWVHSRFDQPSIKPQRDNDVYYSTSLDGGAVWSEPVNVTDFATPDWDCSSGNYAECNRDTFRVFADVSALLDNSDNLHIAFTTTMFYALEDTTSAYASQIWHWSESDQLYTPIRAVDVDYMNDNWATEIGEWVSVLHRPSLSIDPVSGDLFCAYTLAPLDQWSESGIPQSDIWIARSLDDGLHWSTGVNVTNTNGGQNAPAGESLHESNLTLNERVAYEEGAGYLYLTYVLDRDAGCAVGNDPTGPATLNDVLFQQIAINDIPSLPTVDWCWPMLRIDGTGSPCAEQLRDILPDQVNSFALHQNYPNPFNPTTNISFDLLQPAPVKLTVFDITGRELESFHSEKIYPAGTRTVTFDGSGLPSGVYFYRLTAGNITQSKKMILLK